MQQQLDDAVDIEPNFKKIAANLKCSMCISEEGDLFIWGRNSAFDQVKQIPTKIGLLEQFPYYKVVHLTTGLNHAALLLQNQITKLVPERDFKSNVLGVMQIQAQKLREKLKTLHEIDKIFFGHFKNKSKRHVEIDEFRSFYIDHQIFKLINYPSDMKQIIAINNERTKDGKMKGNLFEQALMVEKGLIDILLYYQQLTSGEDLRPEFITLVWGLYGVGQLGIPEEQLTNVMRSSSFGKRLVFAGGESRSSLQISQVTHRTIDQAVGGSALNSTTIIPFIRLHQQFVRISCGHHHTVAVDDNGLLWVWGMGSMGALGTGQISNLLEPQKLDFTQDIYPILDVACGAYHTIILGASNQLISWGVNVRGQLGLGNKENQLLPQEITFFKRQHNPVVPMKIYCGDQHSACITTAKELYTWGNGDYYRLGHGMLIDEIEPKKIEILQDVYVLDVALGTVHSLCITNEGFVYGWGSSKDGVLGISAQQAKDQMLPQRVGITNQAFKDSSFYQLAVGTAHSLALSSKGHVFSWGSNKNSVLGVKLNGLEGSPIPIKIEFCQTIQARGLEKPRFFNNELEEQQEGQDVKKVGFEAVFVLRQAQANKGVDKHVCKYKFGALGAKNTFLIDYQGKLYGAGSSGNGLLCVNPEEKHNFKQIAPNKPTELLNDHAFSPIEVVYFKNTVVNYVACSYNHAIAITSKGNAYCWGQNSHNQLGLGFTSDYVHTPIRLQGAVEQKKIVMACCGERFSAILTTQGEVWTFGTSEYGVLGHERKNYYVINEPRMVNDVNEMIYIACGNQTMMAVDNQQNLWVWGNNTYGQLGITLQREEDENQDELAKPQEGGERSTDKDRILQLKTQLKTMKNAVNYIIYTPQQIQVRALSGEALVSQVACGLYHSLLLTTGGELLSCGLAKYSGHQVVENHVEDESQVKQIKFIDQFSCILAHASKKFKMISCHENSSIAITAVGEILAWGHEIHQRVEQYLKDGFARSKSISGVALGIAGPSHAIVIQETGATLSWGVTVGGKLGLHYNKLFDANKGELKKEIYDPEQMVCYFCDEQTQQKLKLEAEKKEKKIQAQKKRTSRKKGKHQKKQSNVDANVDMSEEEEVLDETSFHSEEGDGHKVQDKLQKGILKQSQDCEAENLYIQDAEIEKRVQTLFKDTAQQAASLQKQYTEVATKISQVIDYRAKNLADLNNSKKLISLKFQVPQFIVRNIQLYECVFSCIYHHPCYMIRLIQSGQLNKFQVLKYIEIIYKNPLMDGSNQAIILTLAIKAFEIEFNNAPSKVDFITELKLFKSSSVFLQIYLMFIEKEEKSSVFFNEISLQLVEEQFFKRAFTHLFESQVDFPRGELSKEDTIKMRNYFNFHQENRDPQDTQVKYNILLEVIVHYCDYIFRLQEQSKISGEDLISPQVRYLHNQIVKTVKDSVLKEELKKLTALFQDNTFIINSKLERFELKLLEKLATFLNHLYFGSITAFILQLQQRILKVNQQFRPFLANEQNLRAVAGAIDRFFQKDPYQKNPYNHDLNKLIEVQQYGTHHYGQIIEVAQSLQGYVQFTVENLNMVELIEEAFQIKDRFLQVEIQDIIFLQQFYCTQIAANPQKAIQSLFVRGIIDPIFIVLRHLGFRQIQTSQFSTEILKRKVNLKLSSSPIMQLAFKTPDVQLFKCEHCKILTTAEYITIEKLKMFTKLRNEGWKCRQSHMNNLNVLDCESKGCSEFITIEALATSRILNFYYREKDEKLDLLVEILLNIGLIAQGTQMYQHLQQTINSSAVKKNARLTHVIETFINNLIYTDKDTKEKETKELKEGGERSPDQIAKFLKNYELTRSKALVEMENRQKHRSLQITYNRLLKQLELTTIDRKMDLQKQIQKLKVSYQVLKLNMRIYAISEAPQPERPKAESYGFFTSANMIKQGILVKLTFQNREIPKILKNVKFYFFAQPDGGWAISIVYLQDALLNLLVPCVSSIYPIELALFHITIPIGQYLELRRMAKYRTQITFKSSNIEITFNIINLIELFNSLNARLIQ